MQKIKKCVICGNEYAAIRKDSRTCSAECYKQLLYRERSRNDEKTTQRDKYSLQNSKKEERKIETMSSCKHRNCIYRGRFGGVASCDFCLETGKPRGCKISECDKFITGKRKKQQIGIFSKAAMSEEDKGRIEVNAFRDQQYRTHNK